MNNTMSFQKVENQSLAQQVEQPPYIGRCQTRWDGASGGHE